MKSNTYIYLVNSEIFNVNLLFFIFSIIKTLLFHTVFTFTFYYNTNTRGKPLET